MRNKIMGWILLFCLLPLYGTAAELFDYYADFEAGRSELYMYTGALQEFQQEAGRNCFKVRSNLPSEDPAGLSKNFSPALQGKIMLQARVNWMYAGDGDHGETLLIGPRRGIQFQTDGTIRYGDTPLGNWTYRTWYLVTMVVDTGAAGQPADIYIDGEKKAEHIPTEITEVDSVAVYAYSTTGDGRGLIDDVRVTNDSSLFPAGSVDQFVMVSSVPQQREQNVAVDTEISMTFNRLLAPETLVPENFVFQPAAEVQGLELDPDGMTVRVQHAPLDSNTEYVISLNGVRDKEGNSADGTTLQFQTRPAVGIVNEFADFNDGSFGSFTQNGYGDISENYGRMCAKIKSEGMMNGVSKEFSVPLSGKVMLEAYVNWMYAGDGDNGEVFYLRGSDGAVWPGVKFRLGDKKILCGETELGSWTHTQWYQVTVVVDFDAPDSPADVYIDGDKKVAAIPTGLKDMVEAKILCYSSTNDGRGAIDDIRITNDPEWFPNDDAVLVASVPETGSVEVDIETKIFLTFDKALDKDTVTPDKFLLSGGEERIAKAVLSGDGYTCQLETDRPLMAKTAYTLAVQEGLKTALGANAGGDGCQITFVTDAGKAYVSEIAFLSEGVPADKLKDGALTAEVKVVNASDSEKKVSIIHALCRPVDESYLFTDYKTAEKTFAPGEAGTITVVLEVKNAENRFVKLFVVEDLAGMVPLRKAAELR